MRVRGGGNAIAFDQISLSQRFFVSFFVIRSGYNHKLCLQSNCCCVAQVGAEAWVVMVKTTTTVVVVWAVGWAESCSLTRKVNTS